jgi:hypothetical protein
MSKLNAILERIPLLPSKKSLGKRALTRGLNYVKGDAQVVGHVKDVDSWDLVPADYATELPGEWREALPPHEVEMADEWYIPQDGSRPYPADGVGGSPGSLYGVPIAVGFRNFGHVRRVPNTDIARNVHKGVQTPGEDDAEPVREPVVTASEEREIQNQRENRIESALNRLSSRLNGVSEQLPDSIVDRVPDESSVAETVAERTPVKPIRQAWTWLQRTREDRASKDKIGRQLVGIGYALMRGEYITKSGADADAVTLVRDEDGQWAVERIDYDVDDGWFESRETDNPYSAGGIGAEPVPFAGTPIGYSLSKYPQLLAAVTPRIGRNMHEVKLAEGGEKYGGDYLNANGQITVTDGGHPEMPNPEQAQTGQDDIMLEERAFVTPEDVSLLGGNEDVTEKIKTIEDRAIASQNMPGSGAMQMMMRYGGLFMALIFGWWMGKQSAGGGGGGGGMGISQFAPMAVVPDPTALMGGVLHIAGMGVF